MNQEQFDFIDEANDDFMKYVQDYFDNLSITLQEVVE